jgi:hypothetical protein
VAKFIEAVDLQSLETGVRGEALAAFAKAALIGRAKHVILNACVDPQFNSRSWDVVMKELLDKFGKTGQI